MNAQAISQACLHGRPPSGRTSAGNEHALASAVARVKGYIEVNFREPINLDSLAAFAGLTRFSLAKQFRQQIGVSPYRYVCEVRVRHAQSMMRQGLRPTEVACEVGFFDQSHLARHFKRSCGMTPREFISDYLHNRSKFICDRVD